jgi:hypothetical protein
MQKIFISCHEDDRIMRDFLSHLNYIGHDPQNGDEIIDL